MGLQQNYPIIVKAFQYRIRGKPHMQTHTSTCRPQLSFEMVMSTDIYSTLKHGDSIKLAQLHFHRQLARPVVILHISSLEGRHRRLAPPLARGLRGVLTAARSRTKGLKQQDITFRTCMSMLRAAR